MTDNNIPERLNLQYTEPPREEEPAPGMQVHPQSGVSSLCGRVGDNVTFHTQGATKRGHFQLLWHWAWKDLGGALFAIFRLFLPSRDK